MQVFREKNLELRFPDEARVLHWDVDDAYRRGLHLCQGTKAVDFCLLTPLHEPVLLELSDLRGHRIENKRHLSGGGMAVEMAEKVRDSLAGMVWACERELTDFEGFDRFIHRFVNRSHKLKVVLWLEQDRSPDPGSADALRSAIDAHLRAWLNAQVIVTSRRLEQQTQHPLGWLEVQGLS